MKEGRRVLSGLFLAVVSIAIILGSISLSLMESGFAVAQAPEISASPEIAFRDILATLVYTPPPGATLVPVDTEVPTLVPTLDFTPNPTCAPPVGWVTFVVPAGETLDGLATRFHVSVEALRNANCMQGSTLTGGMVVFVPNNPPPTARPTRTQPVACGGPPYGWVVYIVRHGDTLYSLSIRYGTTVGYLMSANCLTSSYLVTGQRLYVPFVTATATLRPSATLPPSRTPTRLPTQTQTSQPPAGTPTPTGTPTSTPIISPTRTFVIPPTQTLASTVTPAWLTPTGTEVTMPTNTPWVPPPQPTETPWVPPPQPSDTPWTYPPPVQPPEPPNPYPNPSRTLNLSPHPMLAYRDTSFLEHLVALWIWGLPSP